MPERAPNRPVRKSARAALLASVLAHVGLLVPVLWFVPGKGRERVPVLTAGELVVIVGDDGPARRQPAGTDVMASQVEPPAPTVTPASVGDTPTAPYPTRDQGTEVAPRVRGKPDTAARPTGSGDGASFFQASATGRTVVYVLDRSMSMGLHDGLRQARAELLASLDRLPPTARFQVIAYNQIAEPLCVRNYGGLLSADADTRAEVARAVAALRPTGLSGHVQALCRGLDLQPDVLFFATDADDLTADEVAVVSRRNAGRCSIHVIDFSNRPEDADCPLRQLAAQNRGTYRRVAVKEI